MKEQLRPECYLESLIFSLIHSRRKIESSVSPLARYITGMLNVLLLYHVLVYIVY